MCYGPGPFDNSNGNYVDCYVFGIVWTQLFLITFEISFFDHPSVLKWIAGLHWPGKLREAKNKSRTISKGKTELQGKPTKRIEIDKRTKKLRISNIANFLKLTALVQNTIQTLCQATTKSWSNLSEIEILLWKLTLLNTVPKPFFRFSQNCKSFLLAKITKFCFINYLS